MHVSQLWQHPVKSMIGTPVDSVRVTTDGVSGDRAWAVRDEERGGIRGAKQLGGLMRLSAAYVDGVAGNHVTIALPGGAAVSSSDPDVHQQLSQALQHRVTLWPLQPADDLDHYRRGPSASDDPVADLRSMFGREPHEPLPDLSIFPPVIYEFESPPGTYHDAFPLLLMTTSALRSLAAAVPDSVIDVRRFRPNIVIDTGDEPGHPEFEWVGRTVTIGRVELQIEVACPRCIMVTREVTPELPADRAVLRHIVRDLDQNVGVYATIVTPGDIALGASVVLHP